MSTPSRVSFDLQGRQATSAALLGLHHSFWLKFSSLSHLKMFNAVVCAAQKTESSIRRKAGKWKC